MAPRAQLMKMTQNHASLSARKLPSHPVRPFRNTSHRSSPARTSELIIMNADGPWWACMWLARTGREPVPSQRVGR
jgi:hypothetical protein